MVEQQRWYQSSFDHFFVIYVLFLTNTDCNGVHIQYKYSKIKANEVQTWAKVCKNKQEITLNIIILYMTIPKYNAEKNWSYWNNSIKETIPMIFHIAFMTEIHLITDDHWELKCYRPLNCQRRCDFVYIVQPKLLLKGNFIQINKNINKSKYFSQLPEEVQPCREFWFYLPGLLTTFYRHTVVLKNVFEMSFLNDVSFKN